MAPKRGGGGGGGGGSGSINTSCPDAFQQYGGGISSRVVYFVASCLFFVVALIIMISWRVVRKRHPKTKRLVGPIYALSVLFSLVGYALQIIATMLQECETTDFQSYYNWVIAFDVFFQIAIYLLLVVVLWGVNDLLREHLGSNPVFFKILHGVVLGFMACLTVGYMGLHCYNMWTNTEDGWVVGGASYVRQEQSLSVAYYVFYLLSVVLAGALAIVSIVSMRSRRMTTGSLLGKVIALIFSMLLWIFFVLIYIGSTMGSNVPFDIEVQQAFTYIINGFQAISWILVLFIAKSALFKAPDNTNSQVYNQPTYPAQYPPQQPAYDRVPVPPQQQYAYNNGNLTQQYHYQQQPVYSGSPSPVNANGHMVEVK